MRKIKIILSIILITNACKTTSFDYFYSGLNIQAIDCLCDNKISYIKYRIINTLNKPINLSTIVLEYPDHILCNKFGYTLKVSKSIQITRDKKNILTVLPYDTIIEEVKASFLDFYSIDIGEKYKVYFLQKNKDGIMKNIDTLNFYLCN